MNVLNINKQCTGCGACIDICPVTALKQINDEYGFYKPVINNDNCISCGKCVEVCPLINCNSKYGVLESYYGYNNNSSKRKQSTSGGAFISFAEEVMKENGIIVGAVYDSRFIVKMETTEVVSIDRLMQTKYCQADYNSIFKKIERYINDERKVLVCGTPCQISAMKNYFGNKDNLILVDFFCGGVSSVYALESYIEYLNRKYKSVIKQMNMRSKTRGWSIPHIEVEFENGKKYISHYQLDYYMHYFYSLNIKNEVCLNCKFFQHGDSDITIGDFWGFRTEKIYNDEKGLSLICINTKKGKQLFDRINNETFTAFELTNDQVKYAYKEKKYSKIKLSERKTFLEQMKNDSFVNAAKSNHFKGGKIGIIVRYLIRKVFK